MNIEMLNLLDRFYALIWPMLRISAFLAFSSIFSIRAVSLRIRISIGLVLTVFTGALAGDLTGEVVVEFCASKAPGIRIPSTIEEIRVME